MKLDKIMHYLVTAIQDMETLRTRYEGPLGH
jgi:hypothetical protein